MSKMLRVVEASKKPQTPYSEATLLTAVSRVLSIYIHIQSWNVIIHPWGHFHGGIFAEISILACSYISMKMMDVIAYPRANIA